MKIASVDDTRQTGTIILLNGPTSTGKTSIAKAVQHQFVKPYLHLGADTFVFEICPRPYFLGERGAAGISLAPVAGSDPALIAFQCGPFGQKLISTLHQTVALLATLGHNVVVDHCITEPGWLREC